MDVTPLDIKDRSLCESYLRQENGLLSAYAFENIMLWKDLYKLFKGEIDGCLCIFFQDRIGCFQYMPPLGTRASQSIIDQCFTFMNQRNAQPNISRIENIRSEQFDTYQRYGLRLSQRADEYVAARHALIELSGRHCKKKRASARNFEKRYSFLYRAYEDSLRASCIELYRCWMQDRKRAHHDDLYHHLIEDNFVVFKTMLDCYNEMNYTGRVVIVDGAVVGATFGYHVNDQTFVVLFEVCDLTYRGIAQYIFRRFCQDLTVREINMMDDSGLENLRSVKGSYAGARRPVFTAYYE